jgi:Zn-dependent protease with chaperone function
MATQSTTTVFVGPRDRESFFEAQRRNRRATWRLTAVSALAVVVMGIPLALTITPLLYAAALIIADIISIWLPLPASLWQRADQLAHYGLQAIIWATQGGKSANPQALLLGAAVLLLPGAVLSVGLWLGVNALFRRAGVGGALLALKAREPNPAELKELRLADVVQEMAIAAGLPAPRIMLIDAPAPNAAAIGTSPRDARIVVTRGLLEQLNRDELEGALAHLVASIGNGDLRIAFRVTSVFETFGLLLALLNSPFGSESRRTLWRIVRYGLAGKKGDEASAEEAAAVAALLSRSADLETDDIDRVFDRASSKKSIFRSIGLFLLFPIFLTNIAIKLSLWFFSFSLLVPSLALLWRKRKYLADASAVQLTRNPDGLAEALRKLNSARGPIPGGDWAAHLFLVHPAGNDRMDDPRAHAEQQQKLASVWAASQARGAGNSPSPAQANPQLLMGEIFATGRAAMAGDQNAMARMITFREAAATAFGVPADQLPRMEDLAAAQQGDTAALQGLKNFGMKGAAGQQAQAKSQPDSSSSSIAFTGFFPSLKRRLKQLDRMGAHVELEAGSGKTWIVIAALSLILGPFALAAVALILILIAVLTLASLAFLAIWMAFLHEIFVVLLHH